MQVAKTQRLRFWWSFIVGRRFRTPKFERDFQLLAREPILQFGFIFCWISALPFILFSLAENLLYGRAFTSSITLVRIGLIVMYIAAGWYLIRVPTFARRHYDAIVSALVLLTAWATFGIEYISRLPHNPGFTYISVTVLAVIMIVIIYGFLRLPFKLAAALSVLCTVPAYLCIWPQYSYESVTRMTTYLLTAHIVGPILYRVIDGADRRLFINRLKEQRLAAARARTIAHELEASQAKTRFLAMVSHEVRTPIHGIIQLIDLIDQNGGFKSDEPKSQYFRLLAASCDRILSTFDDLLEYARNGNTVQTLQHERFILATLIRENCVTLEAVAAKQNITFSYHLDQAAGITLFSDASRLARLVTHLVANAIKFTQPGGSIKIAASIEQIDYRLCKVCIQISDTGIGIATDHLQKIFDPFYQIDNTYSRRYEGSGLGLAICKQIATHLKGELIVESTPNIGTSFTFLFTSIADTPLDHVSQQVVVV